MATSSHQQSTRCLVLTKSPGIESRVSPRGWHSKQRLPFLSPERICYLETGLRTNQLTAGTARVVTYASTVAPFVSAIPQQYIDEIKETDAINMLKCLHSEQLRLPSYDLQATYVGPSSAAPPTRGLSPVMLLPGFDASCLEFRRLKPLLDKHAEVWAPDLLGGGFCVPNLEDRPDAPLGPVQRRQHLHALWEKKIKRPMTVVGTSLGAAAAIDLALAHPEAVERLVLLAPQVLTDGIGPMSSLPTFVKRAGIKVLQSEWLRSTAGKMAYCDKQRFATKDSVRIGRLHTYLPGWQDAMLAFMKSGGYRVSSLFPKIQQDVTIAWGRADEILEPSSGKELAEKLPNSRLLHVDACGHCIHLEKPEEAAKIILDAMHGRVEAQ